MKLIHLANTTENVSFEWRIGWWRLIAIYYSCLIWYEYIHHWVKVWCGRFKFYSRRPYIVLDTPVTSGDGLETHRVN